MSSFEIPENYFYKAISFSHGWPLQFVNLSNLLLTALFPLISTCKFILRGCGCGEHRCKRRWSQE